MGFDDSDFASHHVNRKLTTRYLFLVALRTLSWRDKKQTIVASSTSKAEYVSLYTAARKVILHRILAKSVCLVSSRIVGLNGDNQTSLQTDKEAKLTEASNYIDIFYHFIREKVEQGDIILQYVPSEEHLGGSIAERLCGQAHYKLAELKRASLGACDTFGEEESSVTQL